MSTENQTLSHADQMAALRRDFQTLWTDEAYKLRKDGRFTDEQIFWAEKSAWRLLLAYWQRVGR